MATYYLVGSGSWSNPAIWSLSNGGAGGAGIPGSDDYAYIQRTTPVAYTLNLDIDVTVASFYMAQNFPGAVNFGSGTHTITSFQYDGGTLNLQSSVLNVSSFFRFQPGTISMNPGSSVVNLIGNGGIYGASSGSLILSTVVLESASFRSFINVNYLTIDTLILKGYVGMRLADNANINVRRFIASGSAPNYILINSGSTVSNTINVLGSNQIVSASRISIRRSTISGSGTYYAGSSSTDNGNNSGWLFSDAPKVEMLADNFPGSSVNTSKWIATTYITQNSNLVSVNSFGTARNGVLAAKDQFLGEGSYMKFKQDMNVNGSITAYFTNAQQQYGVSARRNIPDIYVNLTSTTGQFFISANSTYTSTTFTNNYLYYRIREASGTIYLDGSTDGIGYTNIKSALASNYGLDTTQLIARPYFVLNSTDVGYASIGAFNVELEPAAEFTQSISSGNTPLTVNFTDQSNFAPTNWSWDFGDSTTSSVQNPSKTYSTPGTYTVSLTSSKTGTSRSVTKTNLITASPNVYTRSISGTILFGGGVSRRLLASRSISGTLLFGGSVRGVVLRDVEGLQDKRYLYKVYQPDGSYIEVWKDVVSEPNFTHEINSIGSTMYVELARNSDSLGTSTEPLLTEAGTNLLTEDNLDILASTTSRNQIGSGSSVDYNNRVDIIAFYGSVEPLLTEMDEEIWTEDDEQLLADIGAPNGRRIFTGFISEINSRYGNSETTVVQLTSYGWDLDQFPIMTAGGDTTVPYNSFDPSNIAKSAIDKFVADSAPYNTYTVRSDSSIQNTGTVVSYSFRVNTFKDVLDKTLELMPSNWYYRIGLGDNTVYYAERSVTPTHVFYLGKHIKALDLKGSIINSTNRVLFTGGGDPALYIDREVTPADRTRRTLNISSDSRVTLLDSAEILAEGQIDQNNKKLYRTTVEIVSRQYDIESINVGDTVGFRNFGNEVDTLVLQVLGLSYNPDTVQLQLETKPPTVSKRLEDLRRNLTVNDNQFVPDSPS